MACGSCGQGRNAPVSKQQATIGGPPVQDRKWALIMPNGTKKIYATEQEAKAANTATGRRGLVRKMP